MWQVRSFSARLVRVFTQIHVGDYRCLLSQAPGTKLRLQEHVDIYSTKHTIGEMNKSLNYIKTDAWKVLEEGKTTSIKGIKILPIDGESPLL